LHSSTSVNDRYSSAAAHIRVDGGKEYTPSLRQFPNDAQTIGTPSVRTTPVDDVYLSLLTPPADGDAVNVRVIIEPLAAWMWFGGAVMAFGAALAAWPRHRRNPLDPVSAPVPTHRDEDAPTGSDESGERDEPEPALTAVD
jgi:cytochrome c biogenesis factor